MLGRPFLEVALAATLLAGCVKVADLEPGEVREPFTARTLYLTGDPGLTETAPTADAPEEVRGGGFFTQWGAERGYAEFVGDPLAESLFVSGNVTLTVHARADGPAFQAGVFPHFIAYFGTDQALAADGSANAAPVLVPGQEFAFEVTIASPQGGLFLEKGTRPRVLLAAVMTQDDRADIVFLVGSVSTPSRAEFQAARASDPPPAGRWVEEAAIGGALAGSAYAGVAGPVYAAAVEDHASDAHALEVAPTTVRVWITLETERAAGFGDLDLAVLDRDGRTIARSVTPTGREDVVLYPADLALGPLDVVVTNYGSAAATYALTVRVAAAA